MTDRDLDHELRDAVAGVASAAVAPPFAAVERRARARRNRAVATVAFGAVAVLSAGVLALPRGGSRTLAPATGGTASPSPSARRIVLPNGDNVATMDGSENADTQRCWTPPAPGTEGAVTIAHGRMGSRAWYVLAWPSTDDTRCVGWSTDPAYDVSWSTDADNDTGPVGALRAKISWEPLDKVGGQTWSVFWGAVPANVVRVHFTYAPGSGDVATIATSLASDRRFLGVTFAVPKGAKSPVLDAGYDAAGHRVPLPPVGP
jgi:hypothetical protein